MSKLILASCLVPALALAGEFDTGCERAATEVWCEGQAAGCKVSAIMESSKQGNDSAKGGYDECLAFAKEVKALGVSLEARRTIKRLQGKLDVLNKELSKEFPFIKVTADFKRLELEDLWKTARFQDHYKTKDRDRSCIVALSSSEDSKEFELRYLNPIKTALYNVGKDDEGKGALKSKVSEVRLGFFTHGRTGWDPDLALKDRVLVIPGLYPQDQTSYTGALQQFIEKNL